MQQAVQPIKINIYDLFIAPSRSFQTDDVADALNYKIITKKVIQHVEEGRFLLLEKLVADVLDICREHPTVTLARVTIDKPHALRFADSVSLSLEYQA